MPDYLDQLFNLPRTTPVPGSPEWVYANYGMIPVGADTWIKPEDWPQYMQLPSGGITAWLQEHQTAVFAIAAGLAAFALLKGVRD